MAVFTCEKCGNKVDTRCKPKKCPACSETGTMCKVEAPAHPRRPRLGPENDNHRRGFLISLSLEG